LGVFGYIFKKKITEKVNNRIKQSHYRPGVAQRIPGSYDSQIS